MPFSSSPELAVPGKNLLELLGRLGDIPRNDLYLISGRTSHWLEKYFGALPVHLIAEHGAKLRYNSSQWKAEASAKGDWKTEVSSIMKVFEQNCTNTFTEEKDFSIVWHYRNAESEQGNLNATRLIEQLKKTLHPNLEIIPGNKIVEVRIKGINKGVVIKTIQANKNYDFVLAIGDDTTDEDMFRVLAGKENSFTVKVGTNASCAQYSLSKPEMVISLLMDMSVL